MSSGIGTPIGNPIGAKPFAFGAGGVGIGVGDSGEGGGDSAPLRTVSQSNRLFSAQDRNASRDSAVFRSFYIISDTTDLIFSINNWVAASGGFTDGEPFTIVDASVDIGGTVVPLLFSGLRSVTVTAGQNDFQSDPLYPSDFGLGSFPAGTIVWIKGRILLAAINTYLVENSHRSVGEKSGCQFAWYLSTDTTVTSTDVSGAYTVATGAALFARTYMFAPLLLGHNPVSDIMTVGLCGDSIGAGLADGGFTESGGGYFQRAAYGSGGSDIVPVINFSIGGTNSSDYIGKAKVQSLYKYVKAMGYAHAANEINGTTVLVDRQNGFNTLVSEFKAGGIEKVFAVPPIARTTSTDSFSTAANQTYLNAGWQPGGVADTFEAWEQTQVGVTIDAFWPTTAIRDATETRKWKTDGVAQKWTQDGLHCKQQSNVDLAVIYAPLIRSI